MGAVCCKMTEEIVDKNNMVDTAVQHDYTDLMVESEIPSHDIEPKIQKQFSQVMPIILKANESSVDSINIESEEPSLLNQELVIESSRKISENEENLQISHKQQEDDEEEKELLGKYSLQQAAASLAIEKSPSRLQQLNEKLSKTEKKTDILETIIFESDVEKCRPGMRVHSIKRWLQITKFNLKYFKNRYTSSVLNKPLTIIPISQIRIVQRVKETTNQERKLRPKFQFEIFLKESVPEKKQGQLCELLSLPKNEEQKSDKTIKADNKIEARDIIRSKSAEILNSKKEDLINKTQLTPQIRARELDSFIENVFDSDQVTPIKENENIDLMPQDPNLQKSMDHDCSPESRKPKETKSISPNKFIELLNFENEAEREQFEIYATNNKTIFVPVPETAPIKHFSSLKRRLADTNTWNPAEKRLLFLTESKDLCDTWIMLLNWLISRLTQSKL